MGASSDTRLQSQRLIEQAFEAVDGSAGLWESA